MRRLVVLCCAGWLSAQAGASLAAPVLELPRFSVQALLGVALPLFLITLTGQYMPGMLVLRNDGFRTSANPIVTVTGLGSLLMKLIIEYGRTEGVRAIRGQVCVEPRRIR